MWPHGLELAEVATVDKPLSDKKTLAPPQRCVRVFDGVSGCIVLHATLNTDATSQTMVLNKNTLEGSEANHRTQLLTPKKKTDNKQKRTRWRQMSSLGSSTRIIKTDRKTPFGGN